MRFLDRKFPGTLTEVGSRRDGQRADSATRLPRRLSRQTFEDPIKACHRPKSGTQGDFRDCESRAQELTSATITATLGGSQTAVLTINVTPILASITLSPSSVIGGRRNATGTASLTAAAPPGGAVVTLSSSNTTAATVPT